MEENNNKSSMTSNSFLMLFSSFLRQGISLFSGVVTARLLLPQDFGIIGMAATFSGLIDVFSRFGFEVFIISRQEISNEEINSIYLSNLLIGVISFILIILGAPFVAELYKTPEVKYILYISAFLFVINSFMSVPRSLLIKNMQSGFVAKMEMVQGFLNSMFIILFAVSGFHYLSYVFALLISNLIICGIYMYKVKWKFSKAMQKPILSEAFAYGKSFLPKTILNYLLYNSDYIFVGFLLGPILLGYYVFGFEKAGYIVALISGMHCSVFFPYFSKIQMENAELKKSFFSIVEKQSLVLYPAIFILIVLAREAINIIYSSRWDHSILTFQLLLGYTFWRITASVIHVLFDAVGKPQENLKHFLLITPICVVTFLIGIKMGGLIGVSIAALLAHTFAGFLLFIRTCRVFQWSFKELMVVLTKYFIPIFLQIPIVIPFKMYLNHIHMPNYIVLIAVASLSTILYMVSIRLIFKDVYVNVIEFYGKKLLSKFRPVSVEG